MLAYRIGLAALVATGLSGMATGRDLQVTLPAGTRLVGALRQTISTKNTPIGTHVALRTTESLVVNDVRLPVGMLVRGEVTEVRSGGRVSGESRLSIQFNQLNVDGREYPIVADLFRVQGKSETRNSLKKVIGGTVAGGVVGAIAGETKEGLLVGAVLGTGLAVATKGGNLTLPAGQKLEVRLVEPVVVTVRSTSAYPQQ
ncbi:MAG TPA: hypothetical protein VFU23_03805 [Gemmatimonadales bacterium]|nr:hypothetical protein [Gemmatimonadales bacterium]